MQRSKQQALMFLLGAVLVGGVLGFSADRAYDHYKKQKEQKARWMDRPSFFDDIGFTPEQRAAWAEISDSTNCRTRLAMAPVSPSLDSIRDRGNAQLRAVMTPEQLVRWEARREALARGGRGGRGGPDRGDGRNEPNGGRAGETRAQGGNGSTGQQQGQTSRRQRLEAELDACRAMLQERKIQ